MAESGHLLAGKRPNRRQNRCGRGGGDRGHGRGCGWSQNGDHGKMKLCRWPNQSEVAPRRQKTVQMVAATVEIGYKIYVTRGDFGGARRSLGCRSGGRGGSQILAGIEPKGWETLKINGNVLKINVKKLGPTWTSQILPCGLTYRVYTKYI